MELVDTNERFGEYLRSIVYLLVLNCTLGLTKLWIGYAGYSSAMRSDGWNNSADFLYSILLAGGLWISTRPADESHPEGHDRFESLMGILIAVVILLTGGYVLWDAYHAYQSPRSIEIGMIGVWVLVASMLLKGAIAWFLTAESDRLNSPSLGAIGRDQAGDVLADLSVIAAVVAALIGENWIDPMVAVIIGGLILKMGWDPLVENVQHLTGGAPTEDTLERLHKVVDSFGKLDRHGPIRAHYVGPTLHVSLTVHAPGDRTLDEIHDAEEALRSELMNVESVGRIFIHVEPHESDSPH